MTIVLDSAFFADHFELFLLNYSNKALNSSDVNGYGNSGRLVELF